MTEEIKGSLIVVEGLDGSGKETQTKKLVERLTVEGLQVKKIEFPRYDSESSALIKMYLRGDFGDKAAINEHYSGKNQKNPRGYKY